MQKKKEGRWVEGEDRGVGLAGKVDSYAQN